MFQHAQLSAEGDMGTVRQTRAAKYADGIGVHRRDDLRNGVLLERAHKVDAGDFSYEGGMQRTDGQSHGVISNEGDRAPI